VPAAQAKSTESGNNKPEQSAYQPLLLITEHFQSLTKMRGFSRAHGGHMDRRANARLCAFCPDNASGAALADLYSEPLAVDLGGLDPALTVDHDWMV
jgi:hypothetical protein